jgi:hypothetical protein
VTIVHLNPERQAVEKPALRSIRQQYRVAA